MKKLPQNDDFDWFSSNSDEFKYIFLNNYKELEQLSTSSMITELFYRSGSSFYYKIWPLQIWTFDRYCIFEFEFWPLGISNFKFLFNRKFFLYLFYPTPKYCVLTINFEWVTLFWTQPLLLGFLIHVTVYIYNRVSP